MWEQNNYIICEKERTCVWKTEEKANVGTNTHKPTQYICEVSSNLAQLFTIKHISKQTLQDPLPSDWIPLSFQMLIILDCWENVWFSQKLYPSFLIEPVPRCRVHSDWKANGFQTYTPTNCCFLHLIWPHAGNRGKINFPMCWLLRYRSLLFR